jgi:hypothetical protein
MRPVLFALLLSSLAGCGGSTVSGSSVEPVTQLVTIRVSGPADSHSTTDCFLLLTSHVDGGGTMRYCLQHFDGEPGPNAVMKDNGTMTFALPDGTLRANVQITQKFAADGRHAAQRLNGTVSGGTERYAGVRGTISGGGDVDEHPPGTIAGSNLRYVVAPGG